MRAEISRNKFSEAAIITGRRQSAKVAEKRKADENEDNGKNRASERKKDNVRSRISGSSS